MKENCHSLVVYEVPKIVVTGFMKTQCPLWGCGRRAGLWRGSVRDRLRKEAVRKTNPNLTTSPALRAGTEAFRECHSEHENS